MKDTRHDKKGKRTRQPRELCVNWEIRATKVYARNIFRGIPQWLYKAVMQIARKMDSTRQLVIIYDNTNTIKSYTTMGMI